MTEPDDWHLRHCRDVTPSIFWGSNRPPAERIGRVGRRDDPMWITARSVCHGCPVIDHCERLTAQSDADHGPWVFSAGKSPEERLIEIRKANQTRHARACRICNGTIPANRKTLCSEAFLTESRRLQSNAWHHANRPPKTTDSQ